MKFGVGQPVRRFEDQTLITGQGRYTDDIKLDNMAQAYVLRAQAAHANIRKIDVTAARQKPGDLHEAQPPPLLVFHEDRILLVVE